MKHVFGGVALRVNFQKESDEFLDVEFSMDASTWLPLDAAGNGVLQASQVLAYLELYSPQVLFLDEPDSHLHPDNQRRLCQLFSDVASERDVQLVMGTHSRHVLDAMRASASVYWLSGGRLVESPDSDITAMLLDIGALDSVDYVAAEQPRCVVATEDTEKELLATLLEANGFNMKETLILPYSGCSKLDAALVLRAFFRERVPGVQLVVHRDGDYLPAAEIKKLQERLTKQGVELFVTTQNDTEHEFLNVAHLAETTGLDPKVVQACIDASLVATRDKSIRKLVAQRFEHAQRERRDGGKSPDVGTISVDSHADYDRDSITFCHGKTVFGEVRSMLQRELGANPDVVRPSKHLAIPTLSDIGMKIWGPRPPGSTTPATQA